MREELLGLRAALNKSWSVGVLGEGPGDGELGLNLGSGTDCFIEGKFFDFSGPLFDHP